MTQTARHHGLSEMSNRRMVKLIRLMLLHRVCELSSTQPLQRANNAVIGPAQLDLIPQFLLDNDADEQTVDRLRRLAKEI